ncbi:helix-turn-helix domain-containing protein [Streptomyces mirabilis]|uniref:helix-turn-helix domain-containing protein n=1 Tax=Streptomyces mirabilis TaxID=68239 RepID=UPI003CCF1ACA
MAPTSGGTCVSELRAAGSPYAREFTNLLQTLKSRADCSYEALARRSGVSGSALQRYCSGVGVPNDFDPIARFGKACGAGPGTPGAAPALGARRRRPKTRGATGRTGLGCLLGCGADSDSGADSRHRRHRVGGDVGQVARHRSRVGGISCELICLACRVEDRSGEFRRPGIRAGAGAVPSPAAVSAPMAGPRR